MRNIYVAESSKELSGRERVMFIQGSSTINKLRDLTNGGNEVIFKPADYAIINKEDPDAPDKNSNTLVIIDDAGNMYSTGSKSAIESFKAIFEAMKGEEPYEVKFLQVSSRQNPGQMYLSCELI